MPPADAAPDTSPDMSAAIAPAGTHALVVYSDLRCPWARVAVHRLLAAAQRRGIESELSVDHRWFPLADEATPDDAAALDRELGAIGALEPDAGWATWEGADRAFPGSSRRAAAWVQAAKGSGHGASTALDQALRNALFTDRADITDDRVIERVAAGVAGLDLDAVRHELASGRPDAELDRHAEQSASDQIPASPTIVAVDGTSWTNPGIDFEHGDDGVPAVQRDEPEIYDEIIETYLAHRHYD